MNSKLISAGRFLVAVVVLALGVFGYVCFERTLVVWCWPVAVSAFVVLLSVPLFYNRWQWLTGTSGSANLLCHVYVVGLVCYSFLLGGNSLLADSSSAHDEEGLVLKKETTTKTIVNRSGRRYRYTRRVTHYYYLTVRFADGTCKKIPVPLSTYNRSREDKPCIFVMQKGFFGFRVVKSAKTP